MTPVFSYIRFISNRKPEGNLPPHHEVTDWPAPDTTGPKIGGSTGTTGACATRSASAHEQKPYHTRGRIHTITLDIVCFLVDLLGDLARVLVLGLRQPLHPLHILLLLFSSRLSSKDLTSQTDETTHTKVFSFDHTIIRVCNFTVMSE